MAGTLMNGCSSSSAPTKIGINGYQQIHLEEENGALTLLSILRAFDGPISEERAWAILYQATKTALDCFALNNRGKSQTRMPPVMSAVEIGGNLLQSHSHDPGETGQYLVNHTNEAFSCFVASETSHLWIHHDGHVHPTSFKLPLHCAEGRKAALTENQLVYGLGWALFEALDFGLKQEEQIVLSPDLEQTIDLMTSVDDEESLNGESHLADDEGIVGDASESSSHCQPTHPKQQQAQQSGTTSGVVLSLSKILERCRMQISSTASDVQADNHFRAVCRALVAETLEFSDFLAKVSTAPEQWHELRRRTEPNVASDLTALHLTDWAKLWVQVIRQLRNGVKLKSTDGCTHKPVEYELTPYEMLMDDIRYRRYKLRQVEGKIPPRVKKDAHAVILEFIRSRPPLRKASERRLRPARKTSTPVELLMESIRKHDLRHLRPTHSLMRVRTEVSASSWIPMAPKLKVIKADQFNLDAEDDDSDSSEEIPPASPPVNHFQRLTIASNEQSTASSTSAKNSSFTTSIPITDDSSCRHRPSSRRHSIVVVPSQFSKAKTTPVIKRQLRESLSASTINPSNLAVPDPRLALHPSHLEGGSLSSNSMRSCLSAVSLPSPPASPLCGGSTSYRLQDDFIHSEEFHQVVHGKLVTLEELVHMRRVLTAASLESLPSKSSAKEEIINGKICFVCRKTRFSVFGAWRHGCKLCARIVCTKCCSKMLIPSDRFDTVSVSELSWPDKHQARPSLSSCSSPSASLFSGFHLKLPQFKVHSPVSRSRSSLEPPSNFPSNGSRSTPTSPLLSRHGSEHAKQGFSQGAGRFVHQALSKHVSLSANSSPVRPHKTEKKSSGVEGYVCRECQSLIEHIHNNLLPTLHGPGQEFLYQSFGMEPCSLP